MRVHVLSSHAFAARVKFRGGWPFNKALLTLLVRCARPSLWLNLQLHVEAAVQLKDDGCWASHLKSWCKTHTANWCCDHPTLYFYFTPEKRYLNVWRVHIRWKHIWKIGVSADNPGSLQRSSRQGQPGHLQLFAGTGRKQWCDMLLVLQGAENPVWTSQLLLPFLLTGDNTGYWKHGEKGLVWFRSAADAT